MTDFTQPGFYRMRNGQKAEVLGYVKGWVIGFVHDDREPDGYVNYWLKNGRSMGEETVKGDDLIAPWVEPKETVVIEGWINVSTKGISCVYPSVMEADVAQNGYRYDCRKIRYTEGVGIVDITDKVDITDRVDITNEGE